MLGEYRNELIITSDKQEQSRADLMPKGLFGKWRIEVDGRGLKGILGNFEL
jgi:hypothetical protein